MLDNRIGCCHLLLIVIPPAVIDTFPSTQANEWKKGRGTQTLALSSMPILRVASSALLAVVKWDRKAPFGLPVVPLNMIEILKQIRIIAEVPYRSVHYDQRIVRNDLSGYGRGQVGVVLGQLLESVCRDVALEIVFGVALAVDGDDVLQQQWIRVGLTVIGSGHHGHDHSLNHLHYL